MRDVERGDTAEPREGDARRRAERYHQIAPRVMGEIVFVSNMFGQVELTKGSAS